MYTFLLPQDYPSLSMIIAKLQEHQIYPVFAVSNHSSDPTKATAVYQLYQVSVGGWEGVGVRVCGCEGVGVRVCGRGCEECRVSGCGRLC